MCEHIVNRMSDVGVANLVTRQPSVSTAPGRGGSKPPAAAQPLDTFNEPIGCVGFGRLRASPTAWLLTFNEMLSGQSVHLRKI